MSMNRYSVYTVTAKEARNRYKREWRKRNPDKTRAATERYWNRQAQKLAQQNAETAEKGAD
jgi:hypothetical protein